jgi:hypothetical protein
VRSSFADELDGRGGASPRRANNVNDLVPGAVRQQAKGSPDLAGSDD